MKKLYFLLLFALIFSGCASFKLWNIPDDFTVKYKLKSHLVGYEQSIEFTQDELRLYYKKPNTEKKFSSINVHGDPFVEDIYNYIMDTDFLHKKQPESDPLTDAPEEIITVRCDSLTNTISFGNIKAPPEYITKLKTMILNLAIYYYKDWIKETETEE